MHSTVAPSLQFRNPESDYVCSDGPPEPLYAPAFVGEYYFQARKEADGVWRFCSFEERHHFTRAALPVNGRNVGPSSAVSDRELAVALAKL